jgi:hypothetical protein
MKVIVCAVASLALLPAAQSAPEDKEIVFLSLEESPSRWISDKPVSLYEKPSNSFVDPFAAGFLVKKSRDSLKPSFMPMLDLPGPGYQRMRGDVPRPKDLL